MDERWHPLGYRRKGEKVKIAGIISEYNPFHNGHAYQIEYLRKHGITHVVCVMSGDTVQRGDLSIFDKHIRSEIAVANGADLVLELPAPYSCSAAADFARAGVSILSRLGCVDLLAFGAETADVAKLEAAAKAVDLLGDEVKAALSNGLTYPQAIASLCDEQVADVLSGANNTLAVEYIRNLENTAIKPIAVKRTVSHDSDEINMSIASASKIRSMIFSGDDVSLLVPEIPSGRPSRLKGIETAVLYKLSMMSLDDFANTPYTDGGIAERLYKASRRANSLDEIYESAKTKNVTHAKVRRAVLLATLGVGKDELRKVPEYARVLALNERGREILGICKKTATVPLSHSLATLSRLSESAKRSAELDELASRLRSLAAGECEVSEYERKLSILPTVN